MEKTAVEWLEFRYKNNITINQYDFEQAKEMEKQQIINAYSEEDMKKCWKEATEDMRKQFSTSYAGMTFEKWFEKIKNK